jgi:transcriptional regulator with XRE-family HTH domain
MAEDEDLNYDFDRLAEKIKAYRKSMGYSQQEFGRKAGLKAQRVGTIESQRIKATLGDLIRLAQTYALSLDELVFDKPAQKPSSSSLPEYDTENNPYASEEVADRILQAIDSLLVRYSEEFANYQDIEAKFDLPQHYIQQFSSNIEVPDMNLIKGLYRLGVNALWLEFGEGNMFEEPAEPPKPKPAARESAPAAAPAPAASSSPQPAKSPSTSNTMLERKVEAIYSLQKLIDAKIDEILER